MATQINSKGASRSRSAARLGVSDEGDQEERTQATGEPDVLLDVPKLTVEEIGLEVDNLHARIALEARLADLVQLHVGADVQIERVALEIKGVDAQAQLKARLHNVLAIIERALETVDEHPEVLGQLAGGVEQIGAAAEGATNGSGSEGSSEGNSEGGSKRRKAAARS